MVRPRYDAPFCGAFFLVPGHPLPGPVATVTGTASAKDTTVGFIYVGSRDDYGYNQAHAAGAAALKKMAVALESEGIHSAEAF